MTAVSAKSHKNLALNTVAFTVCFAAWMINGVLVTFLVSNQVFQWSSVQIGWLMGIPVLTGSVFRLPAGMLTDKFGGKPVFAALLFLSAVPMFMLSKADSFTGFMLCSFGFGFSGVSFAIGIAFSSLWYPRERQGTALGIFGMGNAGAALTTLLAPTILAKLTDGGANPDGWRMLPVYYAGMLTVMGVIFLIFSNNRKPASSSKTFIQMLSPLKNIRVWRFGLYYFLVFGCFVAFSQWLVPYFVNVYMLPLVTAGLFASMFSLPSGVIRALGGWFSDMWGARRVMVCVLGSSVLITFMLSIPQMEIFSPGKGVMVALGGTVTSVSSDSVSVDGREYRLTAKPERTEDYKDDFLILPRKTVWQEPVVAEGQKVQRKELLAKGVTRLFYQSNVWIFAVLAILIGSIWGIGKAAVYKYIPDYFPEEVGVVGGMVGVLGGLGGFFSPIIFGYLLEWTGLWSSCWMFMLFLSGLCLFWLYSVIQKMAKERAPEIENKM